MSQPRERFHFRVTRATASKSRWLNLVRRITREEHEIARAWLFAQPLERDPFDVIGWCDRDAIVHVPGVTCPACGWEAERDARGRLA